MKDRFRQPMFWVVLFEVGLLFALFAVSWRVYQAHRPVAGATAASPTAAAPSPVAAPLDPLPGSPRPSPRSIVSAAPQAGFPVDLAQLNRDQAALEGAETRVLTALVSVGRGYLERVVVPALVRAERAARATPPAITQSTAAMTKMP